MKDYVVTKTGLDVFQRRKKKKKAKKCLTKAEGRGNLTKLSGTAAPRGESLKRKIARFSEKVLDNTAQAC